jgi:hypothetical protein
MKKLNIIYTTKKYLIILHFILTITLLSVLICRCTPRTISVVPQATPNVGINVGKPRHFQEMPKNLIDILNTVQGDARFDIEDRYYSKMETKYSDQIESSVSMLSSTIEKICINNGLSLDPNTIVLTTDFYNDLRQHCEKDSQPLIDFCINLSTDILSCLESIDCIKFKRTQLSVRKSFVNISKDIDNEKSE